VGHALSGEPGEEGVGIAGGSGDNEALTTDGDGQHGGEFGGTGLPTAAVEAEGDASGVTVGEKGQGLFEVEAVGEQDVWDGNGIGVS
jgi:hypothetical protein